MRLADAIINSNSVLPELSEKLRESEIIVCDNVAHLFFNDDNKQWKNDDFPNAAPPFRNMFFEWKVPTKLWGAITTRYMGTHCVVDTSDPEITIFLDDKETFEAKWFLKFTFFQLEKDGEIRLYTLAISVPISNIGIPSRKKMIQSLDGATLDELKENEQIGFDLGYFFVYPALLALSFMHCKNVIVKKPAIPKGLIHKAQKKHDYIPVRYHVLDIEPMKKVLRYEGNAEKTGLKMALHICRGHFKDYSQGKGLFGKYQGLYWWDSHVRGSVEQGIVTKDYNINPVQLPEEDDTKSP